MYVVQYCFEMDQNPIKEHNNSEKHKNVLKHIGMSE
jgi:hypothetical protein